MPENYEEVDLMEYLVVLWKWKYLIVFGALICIVVAGLVSLSLPKVYETSEVIEVGRVRIIPDIEGIGKQELLADINAVKSIIKSESFIDKVICILDLNEKPKQLLGGVKIEGIERTNMLKVSIQATSPQEAVSIAKGIAGLVIESHKEKFDELMKIQNTHKDDVARDVEKMEEGIALRMNTLKGISKNPKVNAPAVILLQQGLLESEGRLTALKDKLQRLEVNLALSNSYNTRIAAEPIAPEGSIAPKVRLNVLIAGLVGLIVFVLLSFFLEYLGKYREGGSRG